MYSTLQYKRTAHTYFCLPIEGEPFSFFIGYSLNKMLMVTVPPHNILSFFMNELVCVVVVCQLFNYLPVFIYLIQRQFASSSCDWFATYNSSFTDKRHRNQGTNEEERCQTIPEKKESRRRADQDVHTYVQVCRTTGLGVVINYS
jgi:hypothetical protein